MADAVAEKMSQANNNMSMPMPRKGEQFRCRVCGMEIEVTADCHCQNGEHVHFECCGQELMKV